MHSVSKHVRHGVVIYLYLVSHSVCFYSISDCRCYNGLDLA